MRLPWGVALFAPLPVKLFPRTIREPDILYFHPANIPTDPQSYPERVDLVMEVVSSGAAAKERDYVAKRSDYARAKISEYWIVDPVQSIITVLSLQGHDYRLECECRTGEVARSSFLPGLTISVDEVLALAKNSSAQATDQPDGSIQSESRSDT